MAAPHIVQSSREQASSSLDAQSYPWQAAGASQEASVPAGMFCQLGLDNFFAALPSAQASFFPTVPPADYGNDLPRASFFPTVPPADYGNNLPRAFSETASQGGGHMPPHMWEETVGWCQAPQFLNITNGLGIDGHLVSPQFGVVPQWSDEMAQQQGIGPQWTEQSRHLDPKSLPVPPLPEHPPALQNLLGFFVERTPETLSATPDCKAPSRSSQSVGESCPRRSSAIRWADLDVESGDSDVDLQQDLFTSPTSIASTGASTTDSPKKIPASFSFASFAALVSKDGADEVSEKSELRCVEWQARRPSQRGARGRGWQNDWSGHPRGKALVQGGGGSSERARPPREHTGIAHKSLKKGSGSGDCSRGSEAGKQYSEQKQASVQHFIDNISPETPRPSRTDISQDTGHDQASDTFQAEDTEECPSSSLKTDQTLIDDTGDVVDEKSCAEASNVNGHTNSEPIQASRRDDVSVSAPIPLCTTEDSAAAEFVANTTKPPNGGSRMPRRKRPKAKLARKGRSSMYDACTQSMERIHTSVSYICRETVNACGDARQSSKNCGLHLQGDKQCIRCHSWSIS